MTYLDLLEIYNLKNDKDLNDIEAIFADADIDERVDKSILAGTILDECGAMHCIYTTSITFKFMSNNFFARYKDSISRVLDALEVKYNPLESINFDWTEKTDIKQDLDTTEDYTEDRTKTNTGTTTTSNTGRTTTSETGSVDVANTGTEDNNGSLTEENKISAMNDSNYQPDSSKNSISTNTRTDDLLEHTDKDLQTIREDALTEEQADDKREEVNANNNRTKNEGLVWDETDTHTERGSKGFAYQDLISKELKIRNFSIYSWIAKKYAKEMFLLVY